MEKLRTTLQRPFTNINARNVGLRTPLHIAAVMDNPKCIEILLDYQKEGILRFITPRIKTETKIIDFNAKDKNGDTPLLLAIKNDSSAAANLILSNLKDISSLPDSLEWKAIWENCQSSKMRKILETHYNKYLEHGGEEIDRICTDIANNTQIYLKWPIIFQNLISLFIDKLEAIFPSAAVLVSRLSKPNIVLRKLKIKEEEVKDKAMKLDSAIELNFEDLLKDINLQKQTCSLPKEKIPNSESSSAYNFLYSIIRRKLPF